MLTEYDEWSAEIEHHNERNSSLLSLVQFSLMCGIFSLVVGTVVSVLRLAFGVSPVITTFSLSFAGFDIWPVF